MTVNSPSLPAISQSPNSPRWRAACGTERLFCSMHDQADGCGRVIFIARFSGPYHEAAIDRALRLVTMACPRCRLLTVPLPAGGYEYRFLNELREPIVQFRPVTDAAEGAMVAAELGAKSLPTGTEPVLRWVVLPAEDGTFQVVGLAHHALFDAASLAILIRRFLQVLDCDSVPDWKWREPTIPQAGWKSVRRHWVGVVRHLAQIVLPIQQCPGLPRVAGAAETCVIHRWSAAETARLTAACRQAHTTVTTLVGITGMFAARAHYGESLTHVDLTVPINVRRYLPAEVAEETLGMLVALRNYAIDFRRPVSLREQAQRVARQLHDFLEYEGPLRFYHSVNLLMPRRITLKEARPACISANSLGRMATAPSLTGVRWLECGWFAHGGPYMPAFSQTAATLDDCLSVTSYSNWIGGDHVRKLAADVDARLRHFAGLDAAESEHLAAEPTVHAISNATAAK